MEAVHIALVLATFLCALVAGFLFAFVVVAMPGIKTLDDGAFIRAFQAMDGVIQNNQPLFILVWAGSVVALAAAGVLGLGAFDGADRGLLLAALAIYLLGVQLPTLLVNVPLNNALQTVQVDETNSSALKRARGDFERRWNRWNAIRTVLACITAVLLMVLLLRI